MKLEEMKQLSNYELLSLQKQCTQIGTANIKDELGLEFSYTSLINELKARGAVQEYHFPGEMPPDPTKQAQEINLKRKRPRTERKSFTIDTETLKRWDEFQEDYPQSYIFASEALKMFMDAYDRGEIRFTLE